MLEALLCEGGRKERPERGMGEGMKGGADQHVLLRVGEKGRAWPWSEVWSIYSLQAELPTLRLPLVSRPLL